MLTQPSLVPYPPTVPQRVPRDSHVRRGLRGRFTRRGVTHKDVAVCVGLAAIGLAVLVPWLLHTRAGSRRTMCEKRQIDTARALAIYEFNKGSFPGYRNLQAIREDGTPQAASWVFPILPHLWTTDDLQRDSTEPLPMAQTATPDQDTLRRWASFRGPFTNVSEERGPQGDVQTRGVQPSMRIAMLLCPADRSFEEQASPLSWVVNCGLPDDRTPEALPEGAVFDETTANANATANDETAANDDATPNDAVSDEDPSNGAAPKAALPDDVANGVFFDHFASRPGNAESLPRVKQTVAFIEAHDGLDHTLLLSENVDAGEWTSTEEPQLGFVWFQTPQGPSATAINHRIGQGDGSYQFARPSSHHAGGVNSVYASGRTRFLAEALDPHVLAQLMTPWEKDRE